ncbi:MAG: hypothetical protein ACFFDI_26250, partial [Promethearchaeota archaeon]
ETSEIETINIGTYQYEKTIEDFEQLYISAEKTYASSKISIFIRSTPVGTRSTLSKFYCFQMRNWFFPLHLVYF